MNLDNLRKELALSYANARLVVLLNKEGSELGNEAREADIFLQDFVFAYAHYSKYNDKRLTELIQTGEL